MTNLIITESTDYDLIIDTAEQWIGEAANAKKAYDPYIDSETDVKTIQLWKQERVIFENNQMMSSRIFTINRPDLYIFYLCRDQEGNIEGIAAIHSRDREQCLELTNLITNPKNISSTLPKRFFSTQEIRGVGSSLLTCVENLALQKKRKGVILDSLDESLPFYLHRDYTQKQDPSGRTYLIKTIEQISKKILDTAA